MTIFSVLTGFSALAMDNYARENQVVVENDGVFLFGAGALNPLMVEKAAAGVCDLCNQLMMGEDTLVSKYFCVLPCNNGLNPHGFHLTCLKQHPHFKDLFGPELIACPTCSAEVLSLNDFLSGLDIDELVRCLRGPQLIIEFYVPNPMRLLFLLGELGIRARALLKRRFGNGLTLL